MNYNELFTHTFFNHDWWGVEQQYGKARNRDFEFSLFLWDSGLDLTEIFEERFYDSNLPLNKLPEAMNAFTRRILDIFVTKDIKSTYEYDGNTHQFQGYVDLVKKYVGQAKPHCNFESGLDYLRNRDQHEALTFTMPIEFHTELIERFENNPKSLETYIYAETMSPF